ncbi:MAG TPA: PAS domain S-box protein, partial [Gemmataceae bacterium]|nr:PAS domain S-box protein [Gemmataceae bacterium]
MTESYQLFLLEGNEEVALLIGMHLKRAGHAVTACRAAADALLVLRHSPCHLVLLADRLADMHGLEVLHALRGDGIRAPVLMMSAKDSEKLAAQAILAGAIDYFVKDDALTFLTELPKRVQEAVARARLQESNQLLVAALESAADGICIADLDGSMLHVNAALAKMTGYERQQLIGQHARLFQSGPQEFALYDGLTQAIRGRRCWQGEVSLRRQDGTHVDTSLSFSPIVDGRGQAAHCVGIYRDITQRKQLERQLLHAQKMQSVGTLAGGVAHEFNNVLAGIQGYATLGLREPGVSPQVNEFLQFIVDLSDRAANLTRQLLAYARKPSLSRQPTNLAKLLIATAELVRKSLAIDVNLEISAPDVEDDALRALADSNQLQQVLINLAVNARDALQRPEPILFRLEQAVLEGELTAFPENVPAGDYVVLEVRDLGQGMRP